MRRDRLEREREDRPRERPDAAVIRVRALVEIRGAVPSGDDRRPSDLWRETRTEAARGERRHPPAGPAETHWQEDEGGVRPHAEYQRETGQRADIQAPSTEAF